MNYQDLKTKLLAAGCHIQVANWYTTIAERNNIQTWDGSVGVALAHVWNDYVITKTVTWYKHFTWYRFTTAARRTVTDGTGCTPHWGNAHIYTTHNYDDRPGYCIHGTYVGGIGADYMCGRCESGDDSWFITICDTCGDAHIKQHPCPHDFDPASLDNTRYTYRTRAWATYISVVDTDFNHWRWEFDGQTSIQHYVTKELAALAFEYAQWHNLDDDNVEAIIPSDDDDDDDEDTVTPAHIAAHIQAALENCTFGPDITDVILCYDELQVHMLDGTSFFVTVTRQRVSDDD